jgi:hypothetical protein
MSYWQLIFLQSRANGAAYDEDGLPVQKWAWSRETWLQRRLRYLQKNKKSANISAQLQTGLEIARQGASQSGENW